MLESALPATISLLGILPPALGMAFVAGIPLSSAWCSILVGSLVVSSFVSHRAQVNGPTTSMLLLMVVLVRDHGWPALAVSTMLVGAIQLLSAYFRLGRWFRSVSPSVLAGQVAGIGFVIAVGQVPKVLGLEGWGALWAEGVDSSALYGVAGLAVLFLWGSKWNPLRKMPALLVMLCLAVLAQRLGWIQGPALDVLGDRQLTTPWAGLDGLGFLAVSDFWMTTMSLFVISTSKALLTAATLRSEGGSIADLNGDLRAFGVGNLISGVLGGMPLSAHLGGSKLLVDAGVKGRGVAVLQAMMLAALFLLSKSGGTLSLPVIALSTLVCFSGVRLIDFAEIRKIKSYGSSEHAVFWVVFAVVVVGGVNAAILVGLGISVFRTVVAISSDLETDLARRGDTNKYFLKLTGAVTFASLPRLYELITRLPEDAQVQVDTSEVYYFDQSCLAFFRDVSERVKGKGRVLVDLDDLSMRAKVPRNVRHQILEEMRELDRRGVTRSDNIGRRKIDRYLYAEEVEKKKAG